jgi:phosphatidate cytidylyltransferase
VAPLVGPWNVAEAALLGALVCIVAPLGDLFESVLKRDLGLKDMGTILPGHGGVLDRIDAILFCVPASYLSLRLFNL